MKYENIVIPVGDNEHVSGILSAPDTYESGKGAGIILAHGAGNDMNNPLLSYLANGLAEYGYVTLRFNFLYKEKGRKAPDSEKVLVNTWKSVYEFLKNHPVYGTEKIIASGKSMGGRIASQIVADGLLNVNRLIFLGYPLHPPGKKEKLKDQHLYRITIPMLFFAGSRDPFCNLEQLNQVISKIASPCSLEIIEKGNHGFHIPKSQNIKEGEVYLKILNKMIAWLESEQVSRKGQI